MEKKVIIYRFKHILSSLLTSALISLKKCKKENEQTRANNLIQNTRQPDKIPTRSQTLCEAFFVIRNIQIIYEYILKLERIEGWLAELPAQVPSRWGKNKQHTPSNSRKISGLEYVYFLLTGLSAHFIVFNFPELPLNFQVDASVSTN